MRFKSTKQFVNYLFEQTELQSETDNQTNLDFVKDLLRKNKFLSDKAEGLTDQNLVQMGEYVFLKFPDTFKHTARHFADTEKGEKIPGSKFLPKYSNEEGLLKLIEKIVTIPPTQENVKEGPTVKDKWLNVDVGEPIGKDSVGKAEDYPNASPVDADANEPIGRNIAIPAIISGGSRVMRADGDKLIPITTPEEIKQASEDTDGKYIIAQKIKTIAAPKKDTNEINLILADLGEGQTKTPDGKKVVSLVTMFPGHEYGFKSKEEYSNNGYVFLSGEPESLKESKMFAELFNNNSNTSRWQKMAGILKG